MGRNYDEINNLDSRLNTAEDDIQDVDQRTSDNEDDIVDLQQKSPTSGNVDYTLDDNVNDDGTYDFVVAKYMDAGDARVVTISFELDLDEDLESYNDDILSLDGSDNDPNENAFGVMWTDADTAYRMQMTTSGYLGYDGTDTINGGTTIQGTITYIVTEE